MLLVNSSQSAKFQQFHKRFFYFLLFNLLIIYSVIYSIILFRNKYIFF